jgi:hypothetical protein
MFSGGLHHFDPAVFRSGPVVQQQHIPRCGQLMAQSSTTRRQNVQQTMRARINPKGYPITCPQKIGLISSLSILFPLLACHRDAPLPFARSQIAPAGPSAASRTPNDQSARQQAPQLTAPLRFRCRAEILHGVHWVRTSAGSSPGPAVTLTRPSPSQPRRPMPCSA